MNKINIIGLLVLIFGLKTLVWSQLVPGKDENIPYLVTVGKHAPLQYGDDDYKQAFYFAVPSSYTSPFYIRIFDPGVGGKLDENNGGFDSKTKFTFFGGANIYSGAKGKNAANLSELYTGDELYSNTYGSEEKYDSSWHTVGPFNPSEGEYVSTFDAFVIKVVAEGILGNDGNVYNYFLSSKSDRNEPVTGSNAFTFEFSIRLNETKNQVSHLYPFIDEKVVSMKLFNFDFDHNTSVSLFSTKRFSEPSNCSGDGEWISSVHKAYDSERGACIDLRFSNEGKNNNGVVFITNQYGEYLPFMSVPIGEVAYVRPFEIKGD